MERFSLTVELAAAAEATHSRHKASLEETFSSLESSFLNNSTIDSSWLSPSLLAKAERNTILSSGSSA